MEYNIKTSNFNINIPENLISQKPNKKREETKLMIIHTKKKKIEHKKFKNIIEYFNKGDIIILNDSKIFPCKLSGHKEKTGAKINVILLREINKNTHIWDVLVDPARKVRIGNKIYFKSKNFKKKKIILISEIIDNTTSRGRIIKFIFKKKYKKLHKIINKIGEIPLPYFINRDVKTIDIKRYKTVYGKKIGSIVPPSAGFHFSKNLLLKLKLKGIKIVYITLHININIFNIINVEDVSKYKMQSEKFIINKYAVKKINKAIKNKKNICVVGCSTMKAIESSISSNNKLTTNKSWSNKFIFPPYKFNIANYMITNFHPAKSSLIMMVSAFLGYKLSMKVYKIAIKKKYNFFSYGDSMLIIKN